MIRRIALELIHKHSIGLDYLIPFFIDLIIEHPLSSWLCIDVPLISPVVSLITLLSLFYFLIRTRVLIKLT